MVKVTRKQAREIAQYLHELYPDIVGAPFPAETKRNHPAKRKLTWVQAQEVRTSTESTPWLARHYGVNTSIISDIRRGQTYKAERFANRSYNTAKLETEE